MAKQRRKVVFEEEELPRIRVWADLAIEQLRSIEGVYDVFAMALKDPHECYYIRIDPRYDEAEVKAEIRSLICSVDRDGRRLHKRGGG